MSANLGLKALAGAVALALAGVASANTSASGGTVGTVFLNITDTTNNTSFFFDTGLTAATFDPNASYNFNLAGDANYTTFKTGAGAADSITYSVIAGYKPTSTNVNVFFTALAAPSAAATGANINQAETQPELFLPNVNGINTTSTNSAYVPSGNNAANWNVGGWEASLNAKLNTADSTSVGTALSFFKEFTNQPGSSLTRGTLTTFAGTWLLTSAGGLTYGSTAVPIPAPLLLLLSGLGLMGVIARRGKSASSEPAFNGAAA